MSFPATAHADQGGPDLTMRAQQASLARLRSRLGAMLEPLTTNGSHDGSASTTIDVIDMFSGCGGMSAGFRSITDVADAPLPRFRHILAIDIDPPANRTYERNIGVVPRALDIHELANNTEELRAEVARSGRDHRNPLVLIGCAPCQGFSSHRNSHGASDPRNTLFVDFARIAAELQPDYVIIENVPEILTDRYWPLVETARQTLGRAGYFTHLTAVNMASFGVPQERFRAVMTAAKTPFYGPQPSRTRSEFSTVRDAIANLPPIIAGAVHSEDPMHRTANHRESTLETIRSVPRDGGNLPLGHGPNSLKELAIRQNKPGYEDVYGRLRWDKPAITITAYSRNPASGRYVHPDQMRGLSIREAACLQSFPADYHFEGTLDQAFRQIGNAVPPVFAAHLALSVLEHHLRDRANMTRSADTEPPEQAPSPVATGFTAPVGPSFSRLIPSFKSGSRTLSEAMTMPLTSISREVQSA